ncbi:MAG: hypothetical protein JSS34_00625 [Proteobacteria bacterium]|nr:hypothetical protein [Pseudomonadota bacterium]
MMLLQNGKSVRNLVCSSDNHFTPEKDRFVESIQKGLSDATKEHLISTKEIKRRLLNKEN